MLKELAISVYAIFCIIVELTVNTECLSLSKRAKAVFYPNIATSEQIDIIENKKIALMQGPKKIDITEAIYEETQNINNYGEETVEEELKEEILETEEKIKDDSIDENEEKISKTEETNITHEEKEQENIQENDEKVEENTTEENENNDDNSNEEVIENCLIIGNKVIKVQITPATQATVNKYDVVQDNEYFSEDDNIVLFGHNYNSFRCLKSVNVGETIRLCNYGNVEEYMVFRSERAMDTSDGTDLVSLKDGEKLLFNYHGYDETLKLITCDENQRWVISAYKMV